MNSLLNRRMKMIGSNRIAQRALIFTNIGTSVATIWWQGDEPALFPKLWIRKSNEFDFREWDYTTITLAAGESVEMYGDNPSGVSSQNNHFMTTGDLELGGHLINFINKDYKNDINILYYPFYYLFYQTSIKIVSFILPYSHTVGVNSLNRYYLNGMFESCTNLYAANFSFGEYFKGRTHDMFKNCTALKIPPKMPGTDEQSIVTLSMNGMFAGCTALEVAPECNLTETMTNQLRNMFSNCTSLRVPPPILPITNGGQWAMIEMFSNCINLETATKCTSEITQFGMYISMYANCPKIKEVEVFFKRRIGGEIGANRTKDAEQMFFNCSSLAKIKVHFKEWLTNDNGDIITLNWVKGVSPTGVFICPEELPEIHDDSHIPVGWTVERYTEE